MSICVCNYTGCYCVIRYIEKKKINKIVLFKSLTKCKRRNKRNLSLKSNSNKIKLCGVGGQHYLVLNKISTLKFHIYGFLQFLRELKNIFHVKGLIRFTFHFKLISKQKEFTRNLKTF